MRHWYSAEHLPFETFVSADGLHMNDWSYACLAKALGMAISEAALRPTAIVGARTGSSLRNDGATSAFVDRDRSHSLERRKHILDEVVGVLEPA